MVDRLEGVSGRMQSSATGISERVSTVSGRSGEGFERVLSEAMRGSAPLRFSAHAQRRIQSRDIQLAEADLSKIHRAVDRAGEKGARDSLVLLDDKAFVVSVRNRVVITALSVPDIKDGVVTNIDSVVVA